MKIKNLKAEELWHRITIRKKVQELNTKYRKILGIPETGFKDESKTEAFFKKISKSKFQLINEYICQCRKDIEIPEGLTFDYLIMRYLINGKVSVTGLNLTGCELVDLNDYDTNGTITLKIGINSTFEDIKSFIEKERHMIKFLQREYRKKHKLSPKKRIRTSLNKKRDSLIYHLAKYPRNKLYEALQEDKPKIEGFYKEGIIRRLLKEISGTDVDINIVRTVIARQKKLREKPV